MNGLETFAAAVVDLANPLSLFNIVWATSLGIAVGMMPGLTATLGIALLTTLTFRLAAGDAILILICMYVGAIYGGSRSAILLNIPGTPANAASALDGFPLARSGRAGEALGIATIGSFAGSLVGMVLLVLIAPQLAEAGLRFQSPEFVWLAVFGVVISGRLTATADPIKGWIAGFLGLLLAQVGQEGIHAYQRFAYTPDLAGGLGLLPALVGAFGFAEVLMVMRQANYQIVRDAGARLLPRLGETLRRWWVMLRSGVLGTAMGIIPGVGEDMGAWVSYAAARRASSAPERFGKGAPEGLLAAEAGNSAAVPGAIIPVLTLAVPGSAPAAVLLAAMFIHGVRPGPMILIESPAFIFEVAAMLFWASLAILALGLLLARPMLKVLQVPRALLMPVVFTLCVVGSFAIASRVFDIYVMLGFGLLGFALRLMHYPIAPLVLGIVLGEMLDRNFRRAMVLSDGSLEPLFTRPICAVLAAVTLLVLVWDLPPLSRARGALLARFR
jgi:putative tricarboxylic transport membrane protein